MSDLVVLGDVAWIDAKLVDPRLSAYSSLPHVSGENIVPVTGELRELRSAAEDGMESGKYLFSEGHVLYSKLRPYLRKASLVDFSGLCSADIYPISTDSNRLSPAYARLLLVSPDFTRFADEASARSRMPKLNREQLFAYEFALPPLADQRRIAQELKAQLAVVEEARRAAQALVDESEALRVAVYRQRFRDVVPVTVPAEGREDAPEGWRWVKLADVAQLESGHTPSRARPDWWGGDVSWVSLTEIRALDGTWVESTEISTNEAGIANSSARILPRGTVCFSRTASVGFVTIMAWPMATSQDFANWVCGDDLDPEFLMYALIRARKELRALATGATHKTIYMPMLASFHLCMPDRATQGAIVQALKAQLAVADEAKRAAQAQLGEIAQLPSRLLAQAFNLQQGAKT